MAELVWQGQKEKTSCGIIKLIKEIQGVLTDNYPVKTLFL
jgi:hypothetical protein